MGLRHNGSGKAGAPAFGLGGVRALLLVGGNPDSRAERFGRVPLAMLDVLGRSVLLRTIDRLRSAGIGEIEIVSDSAPAQLPAAPPACNLHVATSECFWENALQRFRHLARYAECVLVIRLGAWAEIDFAAMISEYRRSGSVIMRAHSRRAEALDVFVVSAHSHSEAAALLRGELRDQRIYMARHRSTGYVNRLTTPADLRTLTLDAFAGECEILACADELRPGVWVGKGARIHPSARIVAPTFIGNYCNVRRAAIVTRGSSLEHHSEVDCATVIDNSSVMPYTRVGAGLEVEYSVAGFKQVHSLHRNATVTISDPHLIGEASPGLSSRLIESVNWALNCVPNVLWKLVFDAVAAEPAQVSASEKLRSSAPVLGDQLAPVESSNESYPEMTATRRYGNE